MDIYVFSNCFSIEYDANIPLSRKNVSTATYEDIKYTEESCDGNCDGKMEKACKMR